jgi:hypothetical protein
LGDSGSARIKILGISSAIVIVAFAGGAVYGELTDGKLQCGSGVRGDLIIEPDFSDITATSPVGALEEAIAENGTGFVGLHDVAGETSELAAGFDPVPPNKDEVSEGGQVFEYKDEAGVLITRVQVAPVGDGRFFVGSAQSCGDEK